MLDDNKIIELLELKHLEEARRTNDPKYCLYHKVIHHPLEKCITLKERIMSLAKMEKSYRTWMTLLKAHCICTQLKSSCSLREGHV